MLVASPNVTSAKLLEREVTRQVRDFLKGHGWRPIRMQRTVMPGQFQTGEPGIADYLFLRYLKPGLGAILWVELKRPGGKIRPQQREWALKECSRGARVWFVEDVAELESVYAREFGWLHDGRLPGQIEMFGGQRG